MRLPPGRMRAMMNKYVVETEQNVLNTNAEIRNECAGRPALPWVSAMATTASRCSLSNTTCLAPPGYWMSAMV